MNNDNDENKNIFKIMDGGKATDALQTAVDTIPQNEYVITDIDDELFFGVGFLLFTSQHIAVMRDEGAGALPVLVVPLSRVKAAALIEDDDDEDELPF